MTQRRTCFIVMPIGDQEYGAVKVSAADLKKRYDDLIKEALMRADSNLEITRADEVPIPGTITSDILTRIMHSDLVVADVTYPNPNVFYELGLRHACRIGTIIIRDKNGPKIPFDIAHLRHIEYENSPSGLKDLADQIGPVIEHFSHNPDSPDSHFQELAKLTEYAFPDYIDRSDEGEAEMEAVTAMMQSPEMLDIFARGATGEKIDQTEMIAAMAKNPAVMGAFARGMVKSGQLSFAPPEPQKSNPKKRSPRKRSTKRKRR